MRQIWATVINNDPFDSEPREKFKKIMDGDKPVIIEFGKKILISERVYNALKDARPKVWQQKPKDPSDPSSSLIMVGEEVQRFPVITDGDWIEPKKKEKVAS